MALASPLYAAGEYKGTEGSKQSQSQLQSQSQSAEQILGMSVVAQDGENIGEIQDIKIDTRNGRINYVTVQKGGVMGIGGDEGIAVPLEAFQFTGENAQLTVDKTKLDNAPKQEDLSDQGFQQELQSHYGVSPAWQEGQPGMESQQMERSRQQQMETDPQRPGATDQPGSTQRPGGMTQ